jgi:F-type H+-transporting ATPase subunit delta
MLADLLALRYAEALVQLAQEHDALAAVESELKLVSAGLAEHRDLAEMFYHPTVPSQAKKETIKQVFGAEVSEIVLHFLLLLIDKGRETVLSAVVKESIRLINAARNIVEAEVTAAIELGEAEQQKLIAKLSALTGKSIVLRINVDPQIIGGVIVRIGDKLIDGSVASRLASMQAALLNTQATKIGVTE